MTENSLLHESWKHAVLIVGALIVIFPFYSMLSYSMKSPSEIMTNKGGFFGSQEKFRDDYCLKLGNEPADCLVTPIIYNYTEAFRKAPLLRYLLNGVICSEECRRKHDTDSSLQHIKDQANQKTIRLYGLDTIVSIKSNFSCKNSLLSCAFVLLI